MLFFLLIPSILPDLPVSSWWASTIGLLLLLLAWQAHLLVFHQVANTQPIEFIPFIGTVLISIPFYTAPRYCGILSAVDRFSSRKSASHGIGMHVSGRVFVAFYYHLDLTLLAKSAVLIISGAGLPGFLIQTPAAASESSCVTRSYGSQP